MSPGKTGWKNNYRKLSNRQKFVRRVGKQAPDRRHPPQNGRASLCTTLSFRVTEINQEKTSWQHLK